MDGWLFTLAAAHPWADGSLPPLDFNVSWRWCRDGCCVVYTTPDGLFCDGQGAVSYGAYVSSVAAEGAARAAAAAVASWYSVDLLVPDGRSSLAVARLWVRTQVIKRKFAAEARLRSRRV